MNTYQWLEDARNEAKPYLYNSQTAWKHNLLNFSVLMLLLGGIFFGSWLSYVRPFSLWLLIPLLCISYAWIILSFGIIGIHESAHNMLFIGKNRKFIKYLHKFIGNMLSTPMGVNYHYFWEVGHIEHHKDPLTHDDAQNCPAVVLGGKLLIKTILLVLFCPGYAVYYTSSCPSKIPPKREILFYIILVGIWGAFAAFSYLTGNWINIGLIHLFGQTFGRAKRPR